MKDKSASRKCQINYSIKENSTVKITAEWLRLWPVLKLMSFHSSMIYIYIYLFIFIFYVREALLGENLWDIPKGCFKNKWNYKQYIQRLYNTPSFLPSISQWFMLLLLNNCISQPIHSLNHITQGLTYKVSQTLSQYNYYNWLCLSISNTSSQQINQYNSQFIHQVSLSLVQSDTSLYIRRPLTRRISRSNYKSKGTFKQSVS